MNTKEYNLLQAKKEKADIKKFKKQCADLVNAPMFAEKMGMNIQSVYNALRDGRINPEDIILICNHPHWSFKKYKRLTVRKRAKPKD